MTRSAAVKVLSPSILRDCLNVHSERDNKRGSLYCADREIMNLRMPMTIQITRPEVEALINRRLETGSFKDAEDVILQALKSSEEEEHASDEDRKAAIERLMAFGRTHGLSLGGMTIRELRDEARP